MMAVSDPRPGDVKQRLWHNTCYILSSLKAIAAQYPSHIADMITATPYGARVRHHGMARVACIDTSSGTRFVLPGLVPPGHSVVCCDKKTIPKKWPTVLRDAFFSTTGANVHCVGYPDQILFWALGCRVHTALLPFGAARGPTLAVLAGMFSAGECVVILTSAHCWAVVAATAGASNDARGWSLTLSDPRSWRPTFTASHANLAAMDEAVAFTVTLGATRALHGTHFSLDTRSISA